MKRRYTNLILIIVLLAAVIWVDLPSTTKVPFTEKSIATVLGLDLRGGMQVILKAEIPAGTEVASDALQIAKQILENRSNGLGVSEVVFQVAGTDRIVGEFPGVTNSEDVINSIKQTGVLEFVDLGDNLWNFVAGDKIVTDFTSAEKVTTIPVPGSASSTGPTGKTTDTGEAPIFHTIMTGQDLSSVVVDSPIAGTYQINFQLTDNGAKVFSDFTSNNVGKILAIVLDNHVISSPSINSAITEGSGTIQGKFTYDEANALAVQLRYGSLPIPLTVEQIRIIGPTLGQDSLNKSLIAGL
ncbi:MAG: protein translocase subunit SecD, partial [Chloroflexi bacterium HGW-Chloroflexi-8]